MNHCWVRLNLTALLCLFVGATVHAQSQHEIRVDPLWGRSFPPERIVPLRVTLQNNSELPVDGAVVIPVTESSAPATFRVPAVVPPRSIKTLTAYACLPADPVSGALSGTGAVPYAIAEWRGADGARLARCEVLARSDSADKPESARSAAPPGGVIVSVELQQAMAETHSIEKLAKFLSANSPYPLSVGQIGPSELPRHRAGYDAVSAIVLSEVNPDLLDAAQRDAILDYVSAGGTLIVPAPIGQAAPRGTWLEPFLPVQIIGTRESNQVDRIRLAAYLGICEAMDAGGEVVLRDKHLVHIALRPVGSGRVVFLSFPINAIAEDDPMRFELWRQILAFDEPLHHWRNSPIALQRALMLESMAGASAAPWRHALLVVCAYLLLSTVVQLFFSGARRPAAYAVMAGVAILGSGLMVAYTTARTPQRDVVSVAQLGFVSLDSQGGGRQCEIMGLLGSHNQKLAITVPDNAILTPLISHANDIPTIGQLPFSVADVGTHPSRLQSVWYADAPVANEYSVHATARFTSTGVEVDINNQSGQQLLAPLIIWNDVAFKLRELPPGRSTFLLGEKNPRGDFTNSTLFTGEDSQLRGRIIQTTHRMQTEGFGSPMHKPLPRLYAWLGDAPTDLSRSMIRTSAEAAKMIRKTLLTSELRVIPTREGEVVTISPEFITITGEEGRGLAYDADSGEWLASILTGTWAIGFQTPAGIGIVEPVSATLNVDLAAAQHKITVRRGQNRDAQSAVDPLGPIVAEWDAAVGTRSVVIDLSSADCDSQGRVWLHVSVESQGGGFGAQWKFNQLSLEMKVKAKPGAK